VKRTMMLWFTCGWVCIATPAFSEHSEGSPGSNTGRPSADPLPMNQLSTYLDSIVVITGIENINPLEETPSSSFLKQLPLLLEGKARVIGVDLLPIGLYFKLNHDYEETLFKTWKKSKIPIVQCGNQYKNELTRLAEDLKITNISFAHCIAVFDFGPWASWLIEHYWIRRNWVKVGKFTIPNAGDGTPPLALQMFLAAGGDPLAVKFAEPISVTQFSEKGIRKISYQDLMDGKVSMDSLKGKFVLIGTDDNWSDVFQNHRGEHFNGVFAHALALAALLRAEDLHRHSLRNQQN
jgi:hypothetical protein